ncbi:hypothetical protein Tco_1120037 [Tanacetum coccineum]
MRPFGYLVTILNTIDHLGSGPNLLFDIDALTNFMKYKPVVVGNQSNSNADPPFSSSLKDSPDAGFKPLGPTVNAASIEDNAVDENIVYGCVDDPNIPELEDCLFR